MKVAEIRKFSDEELLSRLMDAREEQMRLRFQYASGELADHTRLSAGRRTIARFLTVIRERELQTNEESTP